MGCWSPRGCLRPLGLSRPSRRVGRWRRGVGRSWPKSICVTTGRRALVPVWLGGGCDRLLDGGEGLIAQFAEEVVGAPAELAGKREAGAGVVDPRGDLEVVAVVGRADAGARERRFEERPAQHLGPLIGEVAGRALAIGLVDGDVEAGVADGVVGGGEATRVAELGENRGRAHRPDAVQAPAQRAAAGLAARKDAELAGKWCQLLVERIDHPQPELDQLAAGGVVAQRSVRTTARGYAEAVRFAETHAPGVRVWAIEGAGHYGVGLARHLSSRGETVIESGRGPRDDRRLRGKDDPLDAIRAARAALASETVAVPRMGRRREALRLVLVARRGAIDVRRRALVQLRSVIVTAPDRLRAELEALAERRLLDRCSHFRAPV